MDQPFPPTTKKCKSFGGTGLVCDYRNIYYHNRKWFELVDTSNPEACDDGGGEGERGSCLHNEQQQAPKISAVAKTEFLPMKVSTDQMQRHLRGGWGGLINHEVSSGTNLTSGARMLAFESMTYDEPRFHRRTADF